MNVLSWLTGPCEDGTLIDQEQHGKCWLETKPMEGTKCLF